jgi:hypothetical protein
MSIANERDLRASPGRHRRHGEMTARKARFMDEEIKTYRLIWHGPVGDAEFDVDAFDEDDAEHTLAAWLNGDADMGDLIRKV